MNQPSDVPQAKRLFLPFPFQVMFTPFLPSPLENTKVAKLPSEAFKLALYLVQTPGT